MTRQTTNPKIEEIRSEQREAIYGIGMIAFDISMNAMLTTIAETIEAANDATDERKQELLEASYQEKENIRERFGTTLHAVLKMAEGLGRSTEAHKPEDDD